MPIIESKPGCKILDALELVDIETWTYYTLQKTRFDRAQLKTCPNKAVFGATFSGIIWHMPQKYKSTQMHDYIEGPAEDSILYYYYYYYYYLYYWRSEKILNLKQNDWTMWE